MAIKNGDTFQAFYYLAELNAFAVARPDLCPVAVSFYKIVAERGDWTHEIWTQAERAWNRGDRQRALLGYWMMAERGYEVAQNNVAFILDRGACESIILWAGLIKYLHRQIRSSPTFFLESASTPSWSIDQQQHYRPTSADTLDSLSGPRQY